MPRGIACVCCGGGRPRGACLIGSRRCGVGSVYESWLELVPEVSVATRTFGFAVGDESKGNARKTSGSYYTPDSLVQVLLDSALEPVIKETVATNPGKTVEALLSLSIVDP